MGSGTISGPNKGSYGSMLEITWNGNEPIKLLDGEKRSFVQDYDTIILRAKANRSNVRIGFGDCVSRIIPSKPWKKN
jgi:fumarylacetoacetase